MDVHSSGPPRRPTSVPLAGYPRVRRRARDTRPPGRGMQIKSISRPADQSSVELQGKAGTGAFQWNRGGWFGSQLGATLWLVLLGSVLLAQSRWVGGLVVLFGLIPNLVGLLIWRRRHSVSPYPAIQALLAVCGLAALCAMLSIRAAGIAASSLDLPSLWFLLMYPGLMLAFHLQERSARRAAA